MSGLDSNRQFAPSFLYSCQASLKALAWSSKADAEVSGLMSKVLSLRHGEDHTLSVLSSSLAPASAASFSLNKHNAIDTTFTEQSTTTQGLIRLMTKEAHEFERQVEKLEELQIQLDASKEQLLGFASEDLPPASNHPTFPLAPVLPAAVFVSSSVSGSSTSPNSVSPSVAGPSKRPKAFKPKSFKDKNDQGDE